MFLLVDAGQLREHTVSRKSERLVNLTIALLATKRFLTKAEIFKSVAGYSGDSQAKDRMFERDKDDLRSLGIVIELGSFDPLFEDEAGYRIRPESYALQLQDLDAISISLLSQASKLWQEAALGDSAQSGLRKLKSLGIDSDIDSIVGLSTRIESTPEQLPEIIGALGDRRRITFEYVNQDLVSQVRSVEPYRLSNSRGYWYLIGVDTERLALRTFRLDRFASSVSFTSGSKSFEIDEVALDVEESSYQSEFQVALLAIRRGRASQLRKGREVKEIDEEWESISIEFHNVDSILQEVFWHGSDVEILEPLDLREEAIRRLERAVALHE